MTRKAISGFRKIDLGDEFCPFDLAPGPDGRWLLWWPEEKTWVASFPSLEVAHGVIEGGTGETLASQPGWDRSKFPIDVKVALNRIWHKTGKLPRFEFCETSNIFDLYVPLGLGPEALSRLIYYEVQFGGIYQSTIDEYCPLVAQCLSGGQWRLEPDMVARVAPIVTELLLRQTKSQMRLLDEMTAQTQGQRRHRGSGSTGVVEGVR
jgi:hypothetical protein